MNEPHILDLRRSTEHSESHLATEHTTHDRAKTKPLSGAVLRIAIVFVVVGIHFVALPYITDTLSYFSDREMADGNTLLSGSVDFSLLAHASSTFERINCVPNTTITETVRVVPNPDSNPFSYAPYIVNQGGDYGFCDALNTQVTFEGEEVYDGPLSGFSAATTTETGEWEFTFTLQSLHHHRQCNFDIAFTGLQTRHNPGTTDEAFFDVERRGVSLASWGVRINKVYSHVADNRGAAPQNQWIELYNQTNKCIPLKGWEICNGDGCDTIEKHTCIPPQRFAIITGDASTFDYWSVPRGVRRVVLPDSTVGDGLDPESDMLLLKRPDGLVIDALNWGTPDEGWANAHNALWSPGATTTLKGEVFARIQTGFDTNNPEDWHALTPPSIDLIHPNENQEYTWYWHHKMNILWEAFNNNGANDALHIVLYFIRDVNKNGEIDEDDSARRITGLIQNDGAHPWKVPSGWEGYVWIRAVAIGPENPLLNTATTSGRIMLKRPDLGFNVHDFLASFFGGDDGEVYANEFAPDVNLDAFVPVLFPFFPNENYVEDEVEVPVFAIAGDALAAAAAPPTIVAIDEATTTATTTVEILDEKEVASSTPELTATSTEPLVQQNESVQPETDAATTTPGITEQKEVISEGETATTTPEIIEVVEEEGERIETESDISIPAIIEEEVEVVERTEREERGERTDRDTRNELEAEEAAS